MLRQVHDCDVPAFVCGEIGLVQSLGIIGIPVYVVSEFDENVALYSRFAKQKRVVPSYKTDRFIIELLQIGKKFSQKPVLLADNDDAVLAISRHREFLKTLYRFSMPDHKIIEQIQDKKKFYKAAQSFGLPVPSSYAVDSKKELQNVKSELHFPCIIKPANTKDWQNSDFTHVVGPYKKAILCEDREELDSLYKKVSQVHSTVILQEFIQGEDDKHYSINMYFDRNRILKGYYIYQKMRMYPIGAGRGSFFVTVHDLEILEEALRAARKFEMHGLVNIQFKRDGCTGELKLIEMEARLSVSSFLGPAAGMNLAAQYYQDLVADNPTEECHVYQSAIKYSDLLRDIKAFNDYRKQGKLSFWEWMNSYSGKCVCNGYLLEDPFPIIKKMWFTLRHRFNGSVNQKANLTAKFSK